MIFSLIRRKNNYEKSNSILSIDFVPSQQAKILTKKLLSSSNHNNRQLLGEKLLNALSGDAKISLVKLKISATRQWHKKKNGRTVAKLYGYYRPKSNPPSPRLRRAGYIYIQNLTAVRGQTLAPKTFLATLIHEWLHHYDTEKLKLHSIHTKGFYLRLTSLKQQLELI
jgi:hypothetical protein